MFIFNGKSLFGNTGLIISLLILIVLVYLSYNKCYLKNNDGFVCEATNPTSPSCIYPEPKNVRIKISGGSIIVNFSIDINYDKNIPKSFIIVLAQYDNNKNNTGNNKFYLSNETDINPYANSDPTNTKQVELSDNKKPQTNLCTIVNGIPLCEYTFSNIDIKDKYGNIFYYRLGVSAIYEKNGKSVNSEYVTPYNISTSNKMFTLSSSLDNQEQESQCSQTPKSANAYSETISTADGQYELIKSQLGNYPDNLLLDSQTINKNTLSDLVDKSMAQAILNVNVSANPIPDVSTM